MSRPNTLWLLTVLVFAPPCLAGADRDPARLPASPPVALPPLLPEPPHARDAPLLLVDAAPLGAVIDMDDLERFRGGHSEVDNDVLINGTVENNTAENVSTGSNAISDGAFAGSAGINTVIQNTGNNVLIQNGMVVNIQYVAPTP